MTTYRLEYDEHVGYIFIQKVPESQSRTNLLLPLPDAQMLTARLQEMLEQISDYGPNVATISKEWTI